MTERQLLNGFVSQAKKFDYLIKKDGDTFGGHKKPYDGFILHKGLYIAFEAKKEGGSLKLHQAEGLAEVENNGGLAFVMRFRDNGKHSREAFFHPFHNSGEHFAPWVHCPYEKGKYIELDQLPVKLLRAWRAVL